MPKEIQFTSSDTEIIVNLYQTGTSCKQIGKQFNCSKQTINKLLKQNNIEVRDNSHCQQKYQINENIFEKIDSHEKAYWLGMLTGDGSVTNDNDISFSLEIKDSYLVYKFRDFLQSNHPIKIYNNGKKLDGTYSLSCALVFTNKTIAGHLRNHGLNANKTKYITFPQIEDDFLSSYFLGLVDSDGCFCIKTVKKSGLKKLYFSFVGPTEFVITFQDILIKKLNIPKTKLGYQKSTPFIKIAEYGGYKSIYQIVKFIYSNSNVWMDRKKQIAFKYLLTKYPEDKWLLVNSTSPQVPQARETWINSTIHTEYA